MSACKSAFLDYAAFRRVKGVQQLGSVESTVTKLDQVRKTRFKNVTTTGEGHAVDSLNPFAEHVEKALLEARIHILLNRPDVGREHEAVVNEEQITVIARNAVVLEALG